jgi:predicted nuclease of predicted toxin-antitoxin system
VSPLSAVTGDIFIKLPSLRTGRGRSSAYDQSDDRVVWQHAKDNNFMLVTQDSDFAGMAAHYGHPPKVIWLRCGNQPVAAVEALLRRHAKNIAEFDQNIRTSPPLAWKSSDSIPAYGIRIDTSLHGLKQRCPPPHMSTLSSPSHFAIRNRRVQRLIKVSTSLARPSCSWMQS